jgi:hypothetical protein
MRLIKQLNDSIRLLGVVIITLCAGYSMVNGQINPALPAIDLNNYGVVFSKSNFRYPNNINEPNLEFNIRVIDQDGISSSTGHVVTVKFPQSASPQPSGGILYLTFDKSDLPGTNAAFYKGYFQLGNNYSEIDGTYSFNVVKPGMTSIVMTENLVLQTIQGVADTSLKPTCWGDEVRAAFDNIYVKTDSGNYALYDNFDSGIVNTSLWRPDCGSGNLNVNGGELFLSIRDVYNTTGCRVFFQNSAFINGIQADVRTETITTNSSLRRIAGNFFSIVNDADNKLYDVFLKIHVNPNYINVQAEWELGNIAPILYQDYLANNIDLLGKTVTVAVDWDGATVTYTAIIDGVPVEPKTFRPTGIIGPSVSQDKNMEKRLEARMQLITANTSPTISWEPVPGVSRYRVRLYDFDQKTLLTEANVGGTSYRIPPGILRPNAGYYQYTVDTLDSHYAQNTNYTVRAPSFGRMSFWVNNNLVSWPYIELDNVGVETMSDPEDGAYLSFRLRIHDAQGVPGDIKKVTVTFPDSSVKQLFYDASIPTPRSTTGIYRLDYYGIPQPGIYKFYAEDWAGLNSSKTEELIRSEIPVPSGLSPENGAVLFTSAIHDPAIIAWNPVPGKKFYLLEFYDSTGRTVHSVTTEDNSYSLPRGILKEQSFYKVRVFAMREYYDENVDNASQSSKDYLASELYTSKKEGTDGNAPTIDISKKGVYIQTMPGLRAGEQQSYSINFEVKVSDLDGVPENIEFVTVTCPNGETKRLYFQSDLKSGDTYFYRETISSLSGIDGNYLFTVTDFKGHKAIANDYLQYDPNTNPLLPPITGLFPPDGSFVPNPPSFGWDIIPQAMAYRVKIYNGDGFGDNNCVVDSGLLSSIQNQYSPPVDKLADGKTYKYDVFAYRENPDINIGNVSSASVYNSQRSKFTLFFSDSDMDGISKDIDVEPSTFSNDFSDMQTYGKILNRGAQVVRVYDIEAPIGVVVEAYSGGTGNGKSQIEACGGAAIFSLDEGNQIIFTCGSVTARVLTGKSVDVTFYGDYGETGQASIPMGNEIKFEADVFDFSAPASNSVPITVVIDGNPVTIGAGAPPRKSVEIDIKPGESNNAFNPNTHGVLPVAIYGSHTLNVRDIVLEKLTLQGLNVKVAGKKSTNYLAHYEDLNKDGIEDLVVQFEDSNNWQNPGSDYARLTGKLINGIEIEGVDTITIVH